jgi:DNA-binding transcriptional regulator GbsR (MarR family)
MDHLEASWAGCQGCYPRHMIQSKTKVVRNLEADAFVEQCGRLIEVEGLPKTAGRMMGLLMIRDEAMGIDELASELKVSRASISTNSRLLQSLHIADLVSEPGSRRDYLRISGDPCSRLLTLGLHRMQAMRDALRRMSRALNGIQSNNARTRLESMERFYAVAIERVESVLATWGRQQGGSERDTHPQVQIAMSRRKPRTSRRKR